jgi:hypothetical protein
MYALINKSQKLGLSTDIQLHLFDTLVVPIALYGCEVWGCKNVQVIEQLHLKFMRIILKVNRATPNMSTLGSRNRRKCIQDPMIVHKLRSVTSLARSTHT